MRTISVGDRVAYSAAFCRSTGQLTGDVPHATGIVIDLSVGGAVAWVAWNYPDLPNKVHVANLAHVGPNARYCAC